MNRVVLHFPFCLLLAVLACNSETEVESNPATVTTPQAGAPNQQAAPRPEPVRVAIRHILIAHSQAQRRGSVVGRTEKEAAAMAEEIRKRILDGELMTDLAKQYSNDSSAARGGFLGASEKGAWVPAFEEAAFALEINELSEVVHTPYGFHVLRREPLQEIKLRHLLVAHQDAKNVAKKRSVIGERTREEAEEIVRTALAQLNNGDSFQDVADRLSDGPMGKRGADLGWFVRGELGPSFDAVAFDLEVGDYSEVIETIFGFHLIQRVAP
jgi:parvulin-like peptidyl-prolyl isomerase